MPGYSDNIIIIANDSRMAYGGAAAIAGASATTDPDGGVIASTANPATNVSDVQTFFIHMSGTILKAYLNCSDNQTYQDANVGTTVRFRRSFTAGSTITGPSEKIGDVVVPAMTEGSVLEVGFNSGAGFEVFAGEVVQVYALGRAVVGQIGGQLMVSLAFSPRETAPAPWVIGASSYEKGYAGNSGRGRIYPGMAT